MNFAQFVNNAAATRASAHQECTVCFEPMASKPVVCLCESSGKRACPHMFHQECVELSQGINSCHLCKHPFQKVSVMPSPIENPEAWFRFVDSDGNGSLSYDEILEGLKAQLKLEWSKIEMNTDDLWSKWDSDKNGTISLSEFIDPVKGVVPYLKLHYTPTTSTPPPPNIQQDKVSWFEYWDEDHTGSLDKSEVSRALIKTFRTLNIDRVAVAETLEIIWPIFDEDGSGEISMEEFCSRDNLGDTIIAQLMGY